MTTKARKKLLKAPSRPGFIHFLTENKYNAEAATTTTECNQHAFLNVAPPPTFEVRAIAVASILTLACNAAAAVR
jgi:hypothetical protein